MNKNKFSKLNKKTLINFFFGVLMIFILFINFIFYTKYYYFKEGYASKKSDEEEVKELTNFSDAWCRNTSGSNLEKYCKQMRANDCKTMDCCLLAKNGDNEKCLAGNKDGVLFGKQPEYYYYKEKCYGKGCP